MKLTYKTIKPVLSVIGVIALSTIAPQVSYAESVGQCLRHCELGNGQSKHSAIQGAAQLRLQQECEKACQDLGEARSAYIKCIKNATSQSDRKACRADYRSDRPDTWKYR